MQDDPQLKRLFDYTVFHIGLYMTLATGLLATLNLKTTELMDILLFIPIILFIAAGACGGIVASNIPGYERYNSTDGLKGFIDDGYRLWKKKRKFKDWIKYEHRYFWAGVVIAALILGISPFFKQQKPIDAADKITITIEAENARIETTR